LGNRGKDVGQFIYPNGLAIDAAGDLYVTDSLAHRIQKLTFRPALVLLEQGWVSYEKKNYQVALSLWNRSLKIDPRLAETMYAIGTYHLEMGRSSQAIEWFKKALEIDPSYREAKSSLGRAYLKQYSPLITIAGVVLTLLIIYFLRRQNKINALKMRAKQLREEGETRETIFAYEKLLELDRNNLEVCKVLSELYQSEGLEDQSRRVNRTIARLEPGNVLALSQIGKNQLNEGKFSRSADTWKKVIRVSPHNSDAYFYLGMAEAQGTGESEAVNHFLKAFDLEEETLQGLINSADSCIKRKEMARAALKLKAAQSMEPDNRKIEKMIERMGERYEQELVSMARKGLHSGFEVALLAWEQELNDRPSFNAARSAFRAARVKAGELLFDEAKREVGEGRQQAALPMLERVLKLQPGRDDAIELYREVRIDIAFKEGYSCYKDEDYSRAIDCFQQVLSIDPEHEDARKYLRYAYQCMEGGFRARFKHLDL
jgi:tetratricopeptide (TPR) repeat protein